MKTHQTICKRCIMDYSDPDITFNDDGICNHCQRYDVEFPKRVFTGENAKIQLEKITSEIKKNGKNKEYDCIIGVSGGVDSTYVAYLVKELGLKPLAIHFDNGWNSELAVSNIQKTLDVLGIDLYTYVIDWEEFKELQLSFLKSSTPDGEIPTDHAIYALLFREANKRNIKYIISGMNFATESISVPKWAYGHSDWKYIKSVHKKFSQSPLKSYPHYSFFDLFKWTFISKIKVVSILNYVEYNKETTMNILTDKLNWVYYGGKHYESVYTRFFQGYLLPIKFNIDKRRGHLSDLINAKQITRDTALEEMKSNDYTGSLLKQDKEFILKKFKISEEEFNQIELAKPKTFKDYPNSYTLVQNVKKIINYLRTKGLYSK